MRYASLLPISLFCLAALQSCKESREDQLVGEWQEVAVVNPQLEEAIIEQQVFSDTVGRTTTPEQNLALYGTADIEAMRAGLKVNLDSFRKSQFEAVQATRFDFKKGGLLYIHSMDGVDSSNWYLDDDGALIMDEAKLKGAGNKIRMEISELSDTLLKLQFTEQYLTSTAVFKPVKK